MLVLADNQHHPQGIAVYGDWVFWTNKGDSLGVGGGVLRTVK